MGHRCRVPHRGAGGHGSLPGPPSLPQPACPPWEGVALSNPQNRGHTVSLGVSEWYLGHRERARLPAASSPVGQGRSQLTARLSRGRGELWHPMPLPHASPSPRGLLPSAGPMAQPDLLPVANAASPRGMCHP